MKKVKPLYLVITMAVIVIAVVFAAVLIHDSSQSDLSRTQFAILLGEKGLTDDTELNLFMKKASKGEPCSLKITTVDKLEASTEEYEFDGEVYRNITDPNDKGKKFPYILRVGGKRSDGVWEEYLVFSELETVTYEQAWQAGSPFSSFYGERFHAIQI